MAIYHHTKRPLGCHERPDPGNHIAERKRSTLLNVILYDYEEVLLTCLQLGKLAGAH